MMRYIFWMIYSFHTQLLFSIVSIFAPQADRYGAFVIVSIVQTSGLSPPRKNHNLFRQRLKASSNSPITIKLSHSRNNLSFSATHRSCIRNSSELPIFPFTKWFLPISGIGSIGACSILVFFWTTLSWLSRILSHFISRVSHSSRSFS